MYGRWLLFIFHFMLIARVVKYFCRNLLFNFLHFYKSLNEHGDADGDEISFSFFSSIRRLSRLA